MEMSPRIFSAHHEAARLLDIDKFEAGSRYLHFFYIFNFNI